ncbi:MAG: hypothetical protein FJZ96_00090 [Chloroflexi bacterium]|nr:hypothetical protein [Chloroflexota bacterium]
MENQTAKFPPPPRLMTALGAGFDTTANHLLLISLPLLLDIFLWLGPSLSVQELLQPYVDGYSLPEGLAIEGLPDLALVQQAWTDILQGFNLFSFLRTVPLGVSSLVSATLSGVTPFGEAMRLEVGSLAGVLGWLALVAAAGWLLGGLYFYWISSVTLKPETRLPFGAASLQGFILSLLWLGLLVCLAPPALVFLGLLTMISPFLGQAAMFLLAMSSMWIILPVFFSPHGIYAHRQNALAAIWSSLRLARYTLPTSGWFVTVLGLIWIGLDMLWRLPGQDTWLTLVGIAGHAFISTALLSASFIYYRDITAWLEVVLERMKTQKQSLRA